MFLESCCGNKNVVHIDKHLPCSDEVFEGVIHHGLEGGRGVTKTEKHDERFKHPTIGFEGGFPFIPFLDSNVIVPPMDIELTEDLCVFKFVRDIGNEWKGVLVLDREIIKLAVVLNRM